MDLFYCKRHTAPDTTEVKLGFPHTRFKQSQHPRWSILSAAYRNDEFSFWEMLRFSEQTALVVPLSLFTL